MVGNRLDDENRNQSKQQNSKQTMTNRYSQDNYTVPSLSLASSRNKRAVPTKDTTNDYQPSVGKSRYQIMDRISKNNPYTTQNATSNTAISRPPIFKTKSKQIGSASSQSIEGNMESQPITNNYQAINTNQSNEIAFNSNLNRNVYLQRQTDAWDSGSKKKEIFSQRSYQEVEPTTFRPRESQRSQQSSHTLLRNPSSSRMVQAQTEKQIQFKRVDVNKSLFERRMAKLFQEADFYEKQLNDMYSDENMEEIEVSIKELEKLKEQTFKFRECIGAGIV